MQKTKQQLGWVGRKPNLINPQGPALETGLLGSPLPVLWVLLGVGGLLVGFLSCPRAQGPQAFNSSQVLSAEGEGSRGPQPALQPSGLALIPGQSCWPSPHLAVCP